jgi:hypothetical protein
MLAHMLDMVRPRIDKGHVLAGLNHVRAGIAADRTGTDDGYFSAHPVLPLLRGGKLKHDPEKWTPVFGTDHAQKNI